MRALQKLSNLEVFPIQSIYHLASDRRILIVTQTNEYYGLTKEARGIHKSAKDASFTGSKSSLSE